MLLGLEGCQRGHQEHEKPLIRTAVFTMGMWAGQELCKLDREKFVRNCYGFSFEFAR